MKTLFVNGCSWTYGGGLDQPDTKERITDLHDNIVWPAHVKRLMNFDKQVNLAEGCGSNQRICRTTFDWVMQQDADTLKNTTAIIQWSHEDRYEYYLPTDEEANDFQKRYQISPATIQDIHNSQVMSDRTYSVTRNLDRWPKVNPHGVVSPLENQHLNNIVKKGMGRYETYTDQQGMMDWLFHMGFLYDLLTSKGVEVYFWYFTQFVQAMPKEIQDYMYERFPMLGGEEPDSEGGIRRFHFWNYDRISPEDPHPDALGHEQLANHIVNSIAKKIAFLRTPRV